MLDTEIASSCIKNRRPSLDEKRHKLPADSVVISVITCAELLYGVERLESHSSSLSEAVRFFLDVTPCLDWNSDCADWYSRVRHRLTKTGELIGELDMMIAAHALAVNVTLVTNNMRHYARVRPQLRLENWTES